jgi:drug/metabolite transporter (DMT)-like permease
MAIGLAPVFVKQLVATGGLSPVAAGFWRMAVGCCGFSLIVMITSGKRTPKRSIFFEQASIRPLLIAGAMFAFDLVAWHTSFNHTSVASSTLIANLSSIFVPLCGVVFLKERPVKALYIGGSLALIGVVGLTFYRSPSPDMQHQQSLILGEGLALLTAFFYTGYMLAIKQLATRMSSLSAMAASSGISAAILLIIVSVRGDALMPATLPGWFHLLGLGLISQLLGQGLIARALSVLPIGMSALLLLAAPTSTAVFGWIFLGEAMSLGQIVSVLVTLAGIAIVAMR